MSVVIQLKRMHLLSHLLCCYLFFKNVVIDYMLTHQTFEILVTIVNVTVKIFSLLVLTVKWVEVDRK